MKANQLLITVLCATAGASILTAVWQAGTIRTLRTEQAELRQDLRAALTTTKADASVKPVANRTEAERLELIKLRHETRALRESLAEARANQGGLKTLVRSVLPTGAGTPAQMAPEWKGLEKHLTNNYASTMLSVNGTNEYIRFLNLGRAAKLSWAMGYVKQARELAEDALTLNEKLSRGAPEKVHGGVVHDANMVLGRIAVREGRLEDAKQLLLTAGQFGGASGATISEPNMGLAKDLLERGEQATVLKYFELCRKVWSSKEKLALWKEDVEGGRIPDFGSNFIY